MTEQPVETEQQYLGNEPHVHPVYPSAAALLDCSGAHSCTARRHLEGCLSGDTPKSLQHYAPNAHLRRPSWAPVDDVELVALARKSINANKLLGIAKAKAVEAEEALKLALDVEAKAYDAVSEADQALIDFTRKGAGL